MLSLWRGPHTHILQTGAVLVLVEVVALPEAQQVVEVIEQAAGVLLSIFLLSEGIEVEGKLSPPSGQHQDHQAGIETADILLGQDSEDRPRLGGMLAGS